jgi:ornithine cyclodeaminase/alanine dehydrogenase
MFPLKRIKLFGRGQANKDRLGKAAQELGLSVEVCDTGQQAVEDVDLVVTSITVTGGSDPFLDASRLNAGVFATITDLGVPWHKDGFATLDRVTIDDVEQEAVLPNKLCDPGVISGDLSGLVLEKFRGRTSPDDRTAFIFRGHALGDLALSVLALTRYRAAEA